MALQLGALRAALRDAGASDELADRASEELAGYDSRLASIEYRLSLLQWQVGFLIAGVLAMAGLLLRVATKVGALG